MKQTKDVSQDTSASHTPGPWEVSTNGKDWDVCGPDAGDMIADLAECENAEANARLIAAAPEMLAALQGLLKHSPTPKGIKADYSYILYREAAKKAIEAATGASQP